MWSNPFGSGGNRVWIGRPKRRSRHLPPPSREGSSCARQRAAAYRGHWNGRRESRAKANGGGRLDQRCSGAARSRRSGSSTTESGVLQRRVPRSLPLAAPFDVAASSRVRARSRSAVETRPISTGLTRPRALRSDQISSSGGAGPAQRPRRHDGRRRKRWNNPPASRRPRPCQSRPPRGTRGETHGWARRGSPRRSSWFSCTRPARRAGPASRGSCRCDPGPPRPPTD